MNKIILFENKKIRRVWHKEQWYFSVVDVVRVLTESDNPRNYWNMLKAREAEQGIGLYTICVQLKMLAEDGKLRETDCANTESLFRIIQSIPSKNAEPFKLWLAKVGYERLEEIENPELAQERMKLLYEQKGYSKEWVDKRLRGIAVRQGLTQEWKNRGVQDEIGFAVLTNEIMHAAFGKSVKEYKEFKKLNKENLRDHMDDLELVLTLLGEASTTRFTVEKDSHTFPELKKDAGDGGEVAAVARKNIEQKLGKSIISEDNYLDMPERVKRKSLK